MLLCRGSLTVIQKAANAVAEAYAAAPVNSNLEFTIFVKAGSRQANARRYASGTLVMEST